MWAIWVWCRPPQRPFKVPGAYMWGIHARRHHLDTKSIRAVSVNVEHGLWGWPCTRSCAERQWKTTVRGNSFHTLLKLVQVGGLSGLRYCHPHGAMAEWHPALKARRYAPVVPTYSETVLGVLGTCGRSGWGVDPPQRPFRVPGSPCGGEFY